VVARILIWNLFDSMTTLEELRERLPLLPDGDVWIHNDAQDRFGMIAFGEEPPELGSVVALIGHPPEIAEEFDVLD
jgi:hypothetical protein